MAQLIEKSVQKLEEKAATALSHLKYAQRAFVIEFAGTPKSGKSTAVEAIRHFFSRQEFKVHVLAERAAVCPIPMKGHLFFNTWCATSMLAELLANVETDTDIIIVDRGIFDSLVWLRLQEERGELKEDEAAVIADFLLLDRWRSLIDLAVVMRVDAGKAMKREVAQRITSKPGSIMTPKMLQSITRSVIGSLDDHADKFKSVIDEDTTRSKNVRKSNIKLAEKIVDQLERFLNPEIVVVPKAALERVFPDTVGAFGDRIDRIVDCIRRDGAKMCRADAEENSDVVQVVACGVLTRGNEVFLFQRTDADPKSKLHGRTTIWHGTHVAQQGGLSGLPVLEIALNDRLTRSLFLSRQSKRKLKGCCWDRSNEKSNKHLGMMFNVTVDNETANDLRKKQFRHGRGYDLAGKFISWEDLEELRGEVSLEPWSGSILDNRNKFCGAKKHHGST